MPRLLEEFQTNPTGSLVTIRCAPWNYRDKAVLVGDAAHAVVPFYGQGMNAAFEDCVVLDECLEESPNDMQRAFTKYFHARKPNADALADLAVQNFIEMRDKTASPLFRARKKLDHALEGASARNLSAPLRDGDVYANSVCATRRGARVFRMLIVFALLAIAILGLLFAAAWLLVFRKF